MASIGPEGGAADRREDGDDTSVSMNKTPSAANSCHRCGTPAEEGDRYCMRCGVPLRTRDGEETVTAPSARPENPWKRVGERPPFVLGEDRPERLTAGAIFVMMRGGSVPPNSRNWRLG